MFWILFILLILFSRIFLMELWKLIILDKIQRYMIGNGSISVRKLKTKFDLYIYMGCHYQALIWFL